MNLKEKMLHTVILDNHLEFFGSYKPKKNICDIFIVKNKAFTIIYVQYNFI